MWDEKWAVLVLISFSSSCMHECRRYESAAFWMLLIAFRALCEQTEGHWTFLQSGLDLQLFVYIARWLLSYQGWTQRHVCCFRRVTSLYPPSFKNKTLNFVLYLFFSSTESIIPKFTLFCISFLYTAFLTMEFFLWRKSRLYLFPIKDICKSTVN